MRRETTVVFAKRRQTIDKSLGNTTNKFTGYGSQAVAWRRYCRRVTKEPSICNSDDTRRLITRSGRRFDSRDTGAQFVAEFTPRWRRVQAGVLCAVARVAERKALDCRWLARSWRKTVCRIPAVGFPVFSHAGGGVWCLTLTSVVACFGSLAGVTCASFWVTFVSCFIRG